MATVHFTWPSRDLFQFPPSGEPQTLPPPIPGSTSFAPLVRIPDSWYNNALDVRVPITIAAVYACTVPLINAWNRSNGNKPWAIAKTRSFFWFVVAHNVFLAIYSAWTFVGFYGTLRNSLEGFWGANGLASTVDSLCKIHGPRGLGDAVTYDPTTSSWVPQSSSIHLTASGLPHSTDHGRIWNEGLAFYGWFFYLSKFYEVLDTFIILAKGKRSSTLQTYHHAGAMMCMWAGIRFMSPPIWMFVFVNSGIHALMYTYYTLTAFSVYIPHSLKRSLTTLQIIQFLVGSSYAALHSFVSYTIPVKVAVSNITSSIPTTSTAAAAVVAATGSPLVEALKSFLFASVGKPSADTTIPASFISSGAGGSGWQTEFREVPCIDTSGQTFAIWLNVMYLAPLTVLFMRFFVKSYIKMTMGKPAQKKVGNGKATNGSANGHANGHVNGAAKTNGSVKTNGNGKAMNGNGKAH